MEKVVKTFSNYTEFNQPVLLIKSKPLIKNIVQSLTNKYNLPNTRIVIKWNNRFRVAMGAFETGHSKDCCWLILNPKFVLGCMWDWNGYGQKALLNTIGHETCHYICYAKGLHSRDGSDDFEKMLAQNGFSSSSKTAYSRQQSELPMMGYHYSKNNNALILHIDNHSKNQLTSAQIKKLTTKQKQELLAKAEPKLKQLVKDNLLQIGGSEYNDVNIVIEFNGRLRNSMMSFNYYKNNRNTLTAIFNSKVVISNKEDLSNLTMVIRKIISNYYLKYFSRDLKHTNMIG